MLGDPTQLQQVVLNLGVNARDTMPEGGTLLFETETIVLPEARLDGGGADADAGAGPGPGPRVQLRVRDTGAGIAAEVRDRIFDPVFTTKPEGLGTGMGLAVAYGIVENHGGTVRVESTSPAGTSFVVDLPLVAPRVEVAAASRRDAMVSGSGRVLVVDDEEIVRSLAARMLTKLGYETVTAEDGEEAVARFAAQKGTFDLVLLDLVMPRMNGKDCFEHLRRIDPGVRVLLTTGYGQERIVQELLTSGVSGFLAKPYNVGELSRAVAGAMGRGGAVRPHRGGDTAVPPRPVEPYSAGRGTRNPK